MIAFWWMLAFSEFAVGQSVRILPLGNSITEGSDGDPLPEGERISYRYTLYTLLNGAGYNFNFVGHRQGGYAQFPDADHGGIPGTRDQWIERLLQDGYDEKLGIQVTPGSQPYLDVFPADIILLHIGTNDITHNEGTSPGSVEGILNEIDAWKLRSGTDAKVFIARIINRKDYDLTTTQYNNNVAAMVAARNDPDLIMVDMENGAGIDYATDIKDDGIHPFPSGYTKIGQKWFEAIQSLNTAPYFTSSPVTDAIEDQLYTYTVTAEDDNPMDELTLIAGSKPGWLTFTDNEDHTGLLTGTPTQAEIGDHQVLLYVSDGKVLVPQEFTITVGNVNDPPLITGQQSLQTDEEDPLLLEIGDFTVVDGDSPPQDLILLVLPGINYTLDGNTVNPDKDFYGSLQVPVRVTDQADTSSTFQSTIIVNPVNDPPVITGQSGVLEVRQESSLTISVQDVQYEDIDNNINDLSVIVFPDPDMVFQVTGDQVTPQKDTLGTFEVPVVLDDGQDTSNTFLLQVTIIPSSAPPEFTSIPPEEAFVEEQFFYIVDATDPDEEDELEYRATTLPDWLEFNALLHLLGGKPAMEDTGSVWIGIEVTDGKYTVEQLFKVEVKVSATANDFYRRSERYEQRGILKSVYPVPATDKLYVEMDLKGGFSIEVIGASGDLMMTIPGTGPSHTGFHIDLSSLDPGIYFLRLNYGNNMETRKFIVNR